MEIEILKIKKPKYNKVNTFDLKPRRANASRVRDNNRQCPNCLSTLEVAMDGAYECSGDKLSLWEKEFMRYDNLRMEAQKEQFLKKISNKDKFLELYEKRHDLECEYTNRIVDPTPTYNETIPDPLMVGMVEKSIGRLLSEEEKEKGVTFYTDGVNFYTDEGPQRTPFELERINFPDDC